MYTKVIKKKHFLHLFTQSNLTFYFVFSEQRLIMDPSKYRFEDQVTAIEDDLDRYLKKNLQIVFCILKTILNSNSHQWSSCENERTSFMKGSWLVTSLTYVHCTYCSKMFGGKTHLKFHERIQTGEKPYTCKTCNKSFNDPRSSKNMNWSILVSNLTHVNIVTKCSGWKTSKRIMKGFTLENSRILARYARNLSMMQQVLWRDMNWSILVRKCILAWVAINLLVIFLNNRGSFCQCS